MTAASAQAAHIPRLGTLWLWMLVIALCCHLAIAAYILAIPPATSSGGGGKIIGTMNIALGSSAATQLAPDKSQKTVAEDVLAPVPQPVTTKANAPAPAKPKPPAKSPQPRSQPQPPAASLKKQKAQPQTHTSNARAESAPATTASNATQTLGQGAAAAAPGIGGSNNSQTQNYDAYLAMIRARIEAKRTYPASARRSGHEGTTSVQLMIGANGNLTQMRVVRSSGHFALDRAAKRMVTKAAPFPAPPEATFEVTVPIAFALR